MMPPKDADRTPFQLGKAVGAAGEPPECPHEKGSEAATEWLSGWSQGYGRWQDIDRRYRFGAP